MFWILFPAFQVGKLYYRKKGGICKKNIITLLDKT